MAEATLTVKDFQSDQEVRWCPGCGDYAILKSVQSVFPELGIPRENFVVISGIGCSSRFPYYMSTFGFHTIHGRAPGFATGLKVSRPDLEVWVVTGDGDGLSIGGNHLIHALRRNVGIKILLFNNRIYGLTKGQYSPTSPVGKRTSSTPLGSVDNPFNPLALALGAGATFVARSVDIFQAHLKDVLRQAAAHQGTAFVEIYQNCNIFNDGAFAPISDKDTRSDNVIELEHGKPMRFGADGAKGIMLDDRLEPRVVNVADVGEDALLVHDETSANCAAVLSRLGPPNFPTPIGVLRAVERPAYETMMAEQGERAAGAKKQRVQDLLDQGVWEVK